MERFTYDVESTELTNEEHRNFAWAVQALCHLQDQHSVSMTLGSNKEPRNDIFCDNAQKRARQMWKTAIPAESAE